MSKTAREHEAIARSPLEGEPDRACDLVGGYPTILTTYARNMRKESTLWEKKLWARLKSEKLDGYKFRRQQPIGAYIADFYNAEKRLIIELDGSQHSDNIADKARDEALSRLGYRVLRLWNNDLEKNLEGALLHILDALNDTPHRNAEEAFRLPLKGGVGSEFPRITHHASPTEKQ